MLVPIVNPLEKLQSIAANADTLTSASDIHAALDDLGFISEMIEPEFLDTPEELIAVLTERLIKVTPTGRVPLIFNSVSAGSPFILIPNLVTFLLKNH